MAATVDNHDTFLSLKIQEIARDLFLFTAYFGNIFINPKDIVRSPEVRT